MPAPVENVLDAGFELLAVGGERCQSRRLVEDFQALFRRRDRHRMRRVGAAVRRAAVAEGAHDVLAPADGRDRIAVGHRLRERADVGPARRAATARRPSPRGTRSSPRR